MRILNIRLVSNQDDGGIRQSERQYIPELKKNGVKVIGIVMGEGLGNYADQSEDFHYYIPSIFPSYQGGIIARLKSIGKVYYRSVKLSKQIFDLIDFKNELIQNDIVVLNVRRVTLVPLALSIARKLNGKVIFHPGASFRSGPLGVNHIYYFFLKKLACLKILANSQFSANSYKINKNNHVYPGVSSERALNPISPRCVRTELGIDFGVPVLLYMARLNWGKAPDLLLKGFLGSKAASARGAHLIIAGPTQDTKLVEALHRLIGEAGASDRVHIVGKQFDVANWYQAADVFVNSGRGVEAFGISIVEAMAAGLPILTSGYGGPSETVKDNTNGWLVYDLTTEGYREAIEKVFGCFDRWMEYGQRSREFSDEFSVEKQITKYLRYCVE